MLNKIVWIYFPKTTPGPMNDLEAGLASRTAAEVPSKNEWLNLNKYAVHNCHSVQLQEIHVSHKRSAPTLCHR